MKLRVALVLVPALLLAACGPLMQGCAISGTVSISGDLADTTFMTPDDSVTLEFDNCNDGFGQTLNGRFEVVINRFTPGAVVPENYALGVSAVLIDMQLDTAAGSIVGNGDARVVVRNASNVRLDVDNNGNGQIDISIESSWGTLLEQAG